jgi:hypothetical protein
MGPKREGVARPTVPMSEMEEFSTPPPPPALKEPSFFGKLLGYTPNTTLGDQIGRWYEPAGGLGNAIKSAQTAQKNRDGSVLDGLLWPKWEPADVTQRTPASITISAPSQDQAGPEGRWDSYPGSVWLKKGSAWPQQPVLEHELGHNAYVRDTATLRSQEDATEKGAAGWNVPHGGTDRADFYRYALDPAEVDVRLAEIKRRYAFATGRLVDSPEEAQKAWDWWRSNYYESPPDKNDPERPTMTPGQFRIYDNLPGPMQRQMFHRMPELVRSEDRIRRLRPSGGMA